MFFFNGCNKANTVMICGDHVCINKAEANQYFEDNLTIEVKIIEKKKNKSSSLIELNLNNNSPNKREISIIEKEKTNQEVKVLSNDEINEIKTKIKLKKKEKKIVKKINIDKENNINKSSKTIKVKKDDKEIILKKENKKIKTNKNTENNNKEIVDVCTIIEKCSIDEISDFLLKEAKKNKFPDITTRE